MLEAIPFLADLGAPEIAELTASCRRRRYRRGEVVFHKDDPGDALFVIESGAVKVSIESEEGREVILTLLGSGDFFGELTLLDGLPRSANAVAIEASSLLALHRDKFHDFLESHPRASIALLASVSRLVRRSNSFVEDAAFLDVPARLAKILLDISRIHTDKSRETPRLTQATLAAMVGATRESINKWLGFYQRQGWIDVSHGTVNVLAPHELEKQIQIR